MGSKWQWITGVLGIILCLALPAHAQDKPQSSRQAKQELQQLQKNLAAKQTAHKKLVNEAKTLGGEVSKLQKDLISAAASIQAREQSLAELTSDLGRLNIQESNLQSSRTAQQSILYDLSGQLLSLARTPPATLLFAPIAPKEIIQTQLILNQTAPAMMLHVKQAQAQLVALNAVKARKAEQMQRIAVAKAELVSAKSKMDELLAARQQDYAKANDQLEIDEAELKKLAAKANDLQDLIIVLQKSEVAREAARVAAARTNPGKRDTGRVARPLPAVANGALRLPAAGQVVRGYGDKDRDGKPIKGLAIQTTAGSSVVAPAAGDIMYAGPFRSYGQIVILGISKKQFIILGGLGTLNVKAGEQVSMGEPLAKMPDTAAPELYIEIRDGGEPANPAKFGLGAG